MISLTDGGWFCGCAAFDQIVLKRCFVIVWQLDACLSVGVQRTACCGEKKRKAHQAEQAFFHEEDFNARTVVVVALFQFIEAVAPLRALVASH